MRQNCENHGKHKHTTVDNHCMMFQCTAESTVCISDRFICLAAIEEFA